jgi:hypothetical protein
MDAVAARGLARRTPVRNASIKQRGLGFRLRTVSADIQTFLVVKKNVTNCTPLCGLHNSGGQSRTKLIGSLSGWLPFNVEFVLMTITAQLEGYSAITLELTKVLQP